MFVSLIILRYFFLKVVSVEYFFDLSFWKIHLVGFDQVSADINDVFDVVDSAVVFAFVLNVQNVQHLNHASGGFL